MRIIATVDQDGKITAVHSFSYYTSRKKTDEEIMKAVDSSNIQSEYEHFQVITIPEEYENIIEFFLGEDGSKYSRDMSDVYNKLKDLLEMFEDTHNDVFEACQFIEREVQDIKKQIGEKDE